LLGKIASYPTVDIIGENLVSISENGRGILNHIRFNKPKA